MPVQKIGGGKSRDDMLGQLLGQRPVAASDDSPADAPEPVAEPQQAAKQAAEQAAVEPEQPPAQTDKEAAAAATPDKPSAAPEPSRADTPAVTHSQVAAPAAASQTVVSSRDPRLTPAVKEKQPPMTQLANRVPLELKERLDRHRLRSGETINAFLTRMIEYGLDLAEAEAGVDREGRPIQQQ